MQTPAYGCDKPLAILCISNIKRTIHPLIIYIVYPSGSQGSCSQSRLISGERQGWTWAGYHSTGLTQRQLIIHTHTYWQFRVACLLDLYIFGPEETYTGMGRTCHLHRERIWTQIYIFYPFFFFFCYLTLWAFWQMLLNQFTLSVQDEKV